MAGKIPAMAMRKIQKPRKRAQKNSEAWFLNERLEKYKKIMGRPEKNFLLKFSRGKLNLSELGEIPRLRTPLEINMVKLAFEKGRLNAEQAKTALLAKNREEFFSAIGIKTTGSAPPHQNSR